MHMTIIFHAKQTFQCYLIILFHYKHWESAIKLYFYLREMKQTVLHSIKDFLSGTCTGLKKKERYQGAITEQKIHQQFPVLTVLWAFGEDLRCLHLMSINRFEFNLKSASWCRKEGLALCYIPRHGGVHGECRVGVSEAPRRDGVHVLAMPEDRRTALKQLAKAKSGTNRCAFC